MSWREDILSNFSPNAHRLTLAADSDGVLTEEGVAAELKRRSYETLKYADNPIAFRYAYERDYRSRWESGEEPCLIASKPTVDLEDGCQDRRSSRRILGL